MVAYGFKSGFVTPIVSGSKRQTVRGKGAKRHARPGERVQLYQALRTRYARKIIPDPLCVGVDDIQIVVDADAECYIEQVCINGVLHTGEALDAFAWADGFLSLKHFGRFWWISHGAGLFDGVVVRWDPTL